MSGKRNPLKLVKVSDMLMYFADFTQKDLTLTAENSMLSYAGPSLEQPHFANTT